MRNPETDGVVGNGQTLVRGRDGERIELNKEILTRTR